MAIEQIKDSYKFSIIDEKVAENDLFEDKTHIRVANTLYEIITSSSKAVTIGLEGAWGSGKSTVLSFLQNKLQDHQNSSSELGKTLFFVFDAWAHEGDPLRRIFLESLIRSVDPKAEHEGLKRIKEEITGRKKTVTVNAKKSASKLGKWISFSLPFIPLGIALLNRVHFHDIVFWPLSADAGEPAWSFLFSFVFSLLISIAPATVLFFYWCYHKCKKTEKHKISWEIFLTESIEDYVQDITENGERTSIEFEDNFKKIISIASQTYDRVIIVIDNLDRITPENAKGIWSTLQTFFQNRSFTNLQTQYQENVWFLIPFDHKGFSRIWGEENRDLSVYNSFLRKCFQIILEVPAPVMTGWAAYLKQALNKGLIGWTEDNRNIVYDTYISKQSSLEKSPTPREINAFCNQLGVLGSMWGSTVSVEAMSLYAILKENMTVETIREGLIGGKLLEQYANVVDLKKLNAELAGILFGVESSKGMQLLLLPEIKRAFQEGDSVLLSDLEKIHTDGFWVVYGASRNEFEPTIKNGEQYKLLYIDALYGLKDHKEKPLVRKSVVNTINVFLDSFDNMNFSTYNYTESIKKMQDLFSQNDSDDFFNKLKELSKKKLGNIISKVKDEFEESELQNFGFFLNFIEKKANSFETKYYAALEDYKSWIKWIEACGTNLNLYHMVLPNKSVISHMIGNASLNQPHVNKEVLGHILQTFKLYPKNIWNDLPSALIQWTNRNDREYDIEVVYDLMLQLCVRDISFQEISDCVSANDFWRRGQSSSIENNPSLPILVAVCLKEKIQMNTTVSKSVQSFWADSANENKLSQVYSKLEALNQLDVIWELAQDHRNKVALQILNTSNESKLFGLADGTRNIDLLDGFTEGELSVIANKLVEHGSFEKVKGSIEKYVLHYQKVLTIFARLNNKDVQQYINSVVKIVSIDDWLTIIGKKEPLIYLVKDKIPNFTEAIKRFTSEFFSGKLTLEKDEIIVEIPELLANTHDYETITIPYVTKKYFSSEIDVLDDAQFEKFSPLFALSLDKVSMPDLVKKINQWLSLTQTSKVNWLANQDISIEIPYSESEELMARVKDGLESKDEVMQSNAMQINKKFNLGMTKEDIIKDQDDSAEE